MKYPPILKQKVVHQNVLQHSNAILPTPLAFAGFLSPSLYVFPLFLFQSLSQKMTRSNGVTPGVDCLVQESFM